MRRFTLGLILACTLMQVQSSDCPAEDAVFRLGMIGLDTSHVIAFTKAINGDPDNGCHVVAGYAGGSPDVESSASRVEGYTTQLRDTYGMKIVDSIETLCTMVDGILLESVDGRPHLAQVRPVIAAGKPVFIDKPMAGDLADVLEIFRLADEAKVPCWSSSSLRYSPGIISMRHSDELGEVMGCAAFGPCALEAHHPDLYWYGVHGVEILFTIMGPGCQSVRRVQTEGTEHVVGCWDGGRIGTFRGLRSGKKDYGAMVFGSRKVMPSGRYEGYQPLVDEIVTFFRTGVVPVTSAETIEIFAFMSAADRSKAAGGAEVSLASVIQEAQRQNAKDRSRVR